MTPFIRQLAPAAMRIVIAGLCCFGIWSSWQFAYADYLFQENTLESVRKAARVVPDGWEYFLRLADLDEGHAKELWATSLRLNRYNAKADIELGFQYEDEGAFDRAERQLLAAYEVDRTYVPRWSLAAYYFRRNNMPEFWAWARSAAAMPSPDSEELFDMCWEASPDPAQIAREILNNNPDFIRQFIGFLLEKDQPGALAMFAPRLVLTGNSDEDRPLLFSAIDRLVAANDATGANGLWRQLIDRHWVVADSTVPNNANFTREPLPVSFDWSLPEYPGLHSLPGPSGLETEFSGIQPEECTVAEQALVLSPGKYTLAYAYRTTDIPPDTGIRWQFIDVGSNSVLAESPDLSSEALTHSTLSFTVPPGTSLLRLRLRYLRTLGTPRISGSLVVLSSKIQAGT